MCDGLGKNIYYLSPWEFLMLWECLPLPKPGQTYDMDYPDLSLSIGENDFGPNPDAESEDILFFPKGIPGAHDLRSRWYLHRRHRPIVPAPSNTGMPDQQRDAKKKSQLFSLYLRPWVLHAGDYFFLKFDLIAVKTIILFLMYICVYIK